MERMYLTISVFVIFICKCTSFFSSSCSDLIDKRIGTNSYDSIHNFLNLLMPGDDFLELVKHHTPNATDLMLVDVYSDSMPLLLNQVAFFKVMNISVNIIAIAYDDNVCNHNTANNDLYGFIEVPCYYSSTWTQNLLKAFNQVVPPLITSDANYRMFTVMLGRVSMLLHCACHNYNVFINDADVVFMQNPYDNLLFQSDIVVQLTAVANDYSEWGHYFVSENPNRIYTLNNGIIMYRVRSNSIVLKYFIIDLAVEVFLYLKVTSNLLASQQSDSPIVRGFVGFLQVVFNKMAMRANLYLTKGNNDYCYDCYVGELNSHTHNIRINTFPLHRYISNCDLDYHISGSSETKKKQVYDMIFLSKDILIRSKYQFSLTEWASNNNLPLSFHANCAGTNYEDKISLLRKCGLWILDYKSDESIEEIPVESR